MTEAGKLPFFPLWLRHSPVYQEKNNCSERVRDSDISSKNEYTYESAENKFIERGKTWLFTTKCVCTRRTQIQEKGTWGDQFQEVCCLTVIKSQARDGQCLTP